MKVVLDIETIQVPKTEWARLKGISLVEQEQAEDLMAASEASEVDKEYEKSCFDSTFCQIICIGLITFSDAMEPQEAIAWYGGSERELLRQFWARIAQLRPILFITHNGLGFDLPIIRNRSVINQVKPSVEIPLARYRSEPVYDTLAVWSNWEMRGRIKLDVLARVLGCETKSGEGTQVADMWSARQGKNIAEYCLQDCYVTYACYSRMIFREPLGSDKVLLSPNLIEVSE
jgi:DNA polymerase elongation subunit (family B)